MRKYILNYYYKTVLVLLTITAAASAKAVDTIETFDAGAKDVEIYLGFEGIGKKEVEKRVTGLMVLGYGIVNRFSIYGAVSVSGSEKFDQGEAALFMGIFGTPLDTKHFDLDLLLDINGGGDSFKEFQIVPAFELNFDVDPDMKSFGVFLRGSTPVYNRSVLTESDDSKEPDHAVTLHIDTAIGVYQTIALKHQLLLKYTMSFHPLKKDNLPPAETGNISLGYNVVLNDTIELINEVFIHIPNNNDYVSAGLITGLIATLP